MICASLNRPIFIVNLLRYLAEKILLLNTSNFRGDYRRTVDLCSEPLGIFSDCLILAGKFYAWAMFMLRSPFKHHWFPSDVILCAVELPIRPIVSGCAGSACGARHPR
jgi:hypothetical protein